ncbi:hypothetical protein HMJ29_01235 [Hymenobacter taeanensis]|uniref:Uncharacterized protein n=1 Tax=Hymenobacter taeanensis TaxID=2735321 RepID=A0A6M6BCH5_9BACT|nr:MULTISPECIES: hypothetical protein [Hymenobacter]QJX45630.1 hypothetical protein HMJ29_01235 [Hymenobacter taeanensis]UOQ79466.1 hypothetical protein MUN83_11420 [Hymenobacter sp. 5414T-23]
MRQAVAILLLCSLMVQCTGRFGIVAGWWLNQDYIARVLCINRDKPQLKCNGRCHLRKELKAQEEREQKQQTGSKQAAQETLTLFCAAIVPLRLTPPTAFPEATRYAAFRVGHYAWDQPGPDYPPAQG